MNAADLWTVEEKEKALTFVSRWHLKSLQQHRSLVFLAWNSWKEATYHLRKEQEEANEQRLLEDCLNVFRRVAPGTRSAEDIAILQEWLAQKAMSLPAMEKREMDHLCNYVKLMQCERNTLVFLQGEYGDCLYLVMTGGIGLYLEDSKDKEIANFREYSPYRGKHLPYTPGELGRAIKTTVAGESLGELAVLSDNKVRSATGVTTEETILLVVDEPTFNACLRRYYEKQQIMTQTLEFISELALFRDFSHPQRTHIAYNSKHRTFHRGSKIGVQGQPVRSVMLVERGDVKIQSLRRVHGEQRAVVDIAVCSRGSFIGDVELLKNAACFEMTYTAMTTVEVLDMGIQLFQNHMVSPHLRRLPAVQEYLESVGMRVQNHERRGQQGARQRKKLMRLEAGHQNERLRELASVLPLIASNELRPRTTTAASPTSRRIGWGGMAGASSPPAAHEVDMNSIMLEASNAAAQHSLGVGSAYSPRPPTSPYSERRSYHYQAATSPRAFDVPYDLMSQSVMSGAESSVELPGPAHDTGSGTRGVGVPTTDPYAYHQDGRDPFSVNGAASVSVNTAGGGSLIAGHRAGPNAVARFDETTDRLITMAEQTVADIQRQRQGLEELSIPSRALGLTRSPSRGNKFQRGHALLGSMAPRAGGASRFGMGVRSGGFGGAEHPGSSFSGRAGERDATTRFVGSQHGGSNIPQEEQMRSPTSATEPSKAPPTNNKTVAV